MSQSIPKFFKGFVYAWDGMWGAYTERNMKFHGFATLVVVGAGFYYHISQTEWMAVLILVGLIWSAEMVNTCLEELADLIRDELKLPYQATKRVRDIAAGSVLILTIVATIIACMIFLPKIF